MAITPLDEQKKKQSLTGQANMAAARPLADTGAALVAPSAAQTAASAPAWRLAPSSSTNNQLGLMRNEMGTNNTSLTQMAQQIDPSIRKDAERAQQWRVMTPQQRREEVDRLAIEQDVRTASQMSQMTEDDIQKYGRTLADASGTFIDSYGRASPMYSPETQIRIRNAQREIESEWAGALSSYDKTKWQSPQDMYEAIAALPSVQRAGEFGKAIAFNIVRKYSTPQMKAQMEAEDRNQKLFSDWMILRGADELSKAQEQNNGFKFTNDGTGDLATQIALNRDKDLAAGQIWRQFLAETPQIYTAIDGKVGIDQAHAAKFNEAARQKETAEQRTFADTQAKAKQAEQVGQRVSAARETVARREQATGERGRWVVNEQDGSIDDLKQYAEKQTKDLTEREKVAATGELMAQKASYAPLLEYAKYDEAGITVAIEKAVAGIDPTQAPEIRAQMMQSWQYAQSMGGAEGLQKYLNRIDYLISEYSK